MTAAELDQLTQEKAPDLFNKLACHAACQIEALAMSLRDFGAKHPAELDLLMVSASVRLCDLAGALMEVTNGSAGPEAAQTIWGRPLSSFASHIDFATEVDHG